MIYPTEDRFHCFGCNADGDVFNWIEKIENVDFQTAVEHLAARAGIAIPIADADDPKAKYRTRLLSINRLAANYYYRQLLGNDRRGEHYLISRGVTGKTVQQFGLGYAPDDWTNLVQYLRGEGVTDTEMLDANLARHGRNGLIDAFRGRIMFPIVDSRGNVIAFGGRSVTDTNPKYLNSANTPVFEKSRTLYGRVKPGARVILVEGYMDVVLLTQAGFENVVATLGTAFAETHLHALRNASELVVAYDGDEAGKKASRRAVMQLATTELPAKVAVMPPGKDPADLVVAPEQLRLILEKAQDALTWILEDNAEGLDCNMPAGKAQFEKRSIPILNQIKNPVRQRIYANFVAEKCGVPQTEIIRQLHAASSESTIKRATTPMPFQTVEPKAESQKSVTEEELRASIEKRQSELKRRKA